jgi:hypothetical protein
LFSFYYFLLVRFDWICFGVLFGFFEDFLVSLIEVEGFLSSVESMQFLLDVNL